MRVFVTGTGRCGTTTFHRACRHITNYTTRHETPITAALAYPDRHIEVSPHLCWVMPALTARYPHAIFVHLRRCREEVIASWLERGPSRGPGHSARMAHMRFGDDFQQVCELYYDIMVAQIDNYANRCNLHQFWLREMPDRWREFWDLISAEGDFEASAAEWDNRYNASKAKASA